MDVTFNSRNLKLLQKITEEIKIQIDKHENLSNVINDVVVKYRLLPINIGKSNVIRKNNSEEYACTICNKPFKIGHSIRTLHACKHRFHTKCIDNWLIDNKQCCFVCEKPSIKCSQIPYRIREKYKPNVIVTKRKNE